MTLVALSVRRQGHLCISRQSGTWLWTRDPAGS